MLTKAIVLKSIGCRTNQEEMNTLAFCLTQEGNNVIDSIDAADVIIVNTCSVTSVTEAKTMRMLRQISRNAPGASICVTGCLAQQSAEKLLCMPNVKWVVGNYLKNEIPCILTRGKTGIFLEAAEQAQSSLKLPDADIFFNTSRRTRFPVKIQEGCDFHCAYCIVPLLRGKSRSASVDDILDACRKAIASGFKEIVLTGTHIGQYLAGDSVDLTGLINKIVETPGDYRLRLGSLDPGDLSDDLVSLVTTHPRVCRHLHVSVQSLSTAVVGKMGRSPEAMNKAVGKLLEVRKVFPFTGIGGDFIVGFPGETDDMFWETLKSIRNIGFSYGHVFRYSKRPSTAAVDFPDQIDEKEKNSRSVRLRAVIDECKNAFVNNCIDVPQRIVTETDDPVTGLTSNYLRVIVPNAAVGRNVWSDVAIADAKIEKGLCRATAL
jgi:threonylcarbamoyladenosine tRNA methylthiotransferase MtaB